MSNEKKLPPLTKTEFQATTKQVKAFIENLQFRTLTGGTMTVEQFSEEIAVFDKPLAEKLRSWATIGNQVAKHIGTRSETVN